MRRSFHGTSARLARVSTADQQPHLEVNALTAAACYRVFTETASGACTDRPTQEQLLDQEQLCPAGSFDSPPPPDWSPRPLRRSSPSPIWLLGVDVATSAHPESGEGWTSHRRHVNQTGQTIGDSGGGGSQDDGALPLWLPSWSLAPARTVSSVGRRCPRSGTRCWRPWIYRGAHDFHHTFATWLEDAGIPARVIDELMGHEATGRSGEQRGSVMGAHYRHTTTEMATRAVDAIQQRLSVTLDVAPPGS